MTDSFFMSNELLRWGLCKYSYYCRFWLGWVIKFELFLVWTVIIYLCESYYWTITLAFYKWCNQIRSMCTHTGGSTYLFLCFLWLGLMNIIATSPVTASLSDSSSCCCSPIYFNLLLLLTAHWQILNIPLSWSTGEAQSSPSVLFKHRVEGGFVLKKQRGIKV